MKKEKVIFTLTLLIVCYAIFETSKSFFNQPSREVKILSYNNESMTSEQRETSIDKKQLDVDSWGRDIFHDRSKIYNGWFNLTGITRFENHYRAIINGKILKKMDQVRGFTLKRITDDRVLLTRDEFRVTLKLEK